MDFDEVVTLKSRTGKDEEFICNSKPYIISTKKGLRIPRYMADLAMTQNALGWDGSTGVVNDAKIYVEEDVETPLATPTTKITDEEVEAAKATDGLGNDTILIDGRPVKKKSINLKPFKEDYSKNNIAG